MTDERKQKDELLKTVGDYWSTRSEGFSEYILEHLDGDENKLYFRRIREFSDTRKMKVLDIGCGPGMFSILLGKDGHDVTAIDYSDGMIEQAKANCAKEGVAANIIKMDAQNLNFPDRSFDLVVSRKVVWNLPDPVRAYSEWLRVLKDDGKMILFDGNYFLSMHDKEYADHSEKMREIYKDKIPEKREGKAYNQGGDPNVIRGFAKELPLSKERRPAWDVRTLTEMGVKCIKVDIDTSFEVERENGSMVQLPNTFILTVSKNN